MTAGSRLLTVVAALVAVVAGGVVAGVVLLRHALHPADAAATSARSADTRLVSATRPAAPLAADAPLGASGARLTVAPSWLGRVARRSGVPVRALQAYATAALQLRAEQPRCRLGWPTLAGLGAVESDHGRHGGGGLRIDGRPTEPIVGVALDGGPAVAAIRDTDGGDLDGDPTWDRAVGPLQFIPSTWAHWAADGNRDGTADPQNVDDAALAAGRYLCASGGRLDRGAPWWHAIRSYNDSDRYARDVLDAADSYARASW